jgi:hypothetical protein
MEQSMNSSYKIIFHFAVYVLFVICGFAVSVQSQNFSFVKHPIDLNFDGINFIKVIDFDGDNDLDIVGGSSVTPTTASLGLAWWRNDGDNNWSRFEIDADFIDVMSVDVAKVDGDDYYDVVATSWQLSQLSWWKNSGDPTQGWSKSILKSNFGNAHDARCIDMDFDGDMDIVSANATPGSIIILYNDGGNPPVWKQFTLAQSFLGALAVNIIDLDYDNDFDILGAASNADEVAWWENLGGNPASWDKKIIDSDFGGSGDITVIDLNKNSKLDIIATGWSSSQVAYWINEDIQSNSWTKHVVDNELGIAARVRAEDLDNDFDVDIVAIGNFPGALMIYENNDFVWTKDILTIEFKRSAALSLNDLDKDGDLDIIAGGANFLYWWQNDSPISSKNDSEDYMPIEFMLEQNYPNPFNPRTTIGIELPYREFVSLKVYNGLGNVIETLANEEKQAGTYEFEFDGKELTSGIYFYTLIAESFSETKKMILLK